MKLPILNSLPPCSADFPICAFACFRANSRAFLVLSPNNLHSTRVSTCNPGKSREIPKTAPKSSSNRRSQHSRRKPLISRISRSPFSPFPLVRIDSHQKNPVIPHFPLNPTSFFSRSSSEISSRFPSQFPDFHQKTPVISTISKYFHSRNPSSFPQSHFVAFGKDLLSFTLSEDSALLLRTITPFPRRFLSPQPLRRRAIEIDTSQPKTHFLVNNMADNTPNIPGPGAVPPAGATPPAAPKSESGKIQPKKETVRINLPPKPTAAPTIKIPAPSAIHAAAPAASAAPSAGAPAAAPRAAAPSAPASAAAAPRPASAPAAPAPRPAAAPRYAAAGGGLDTVDKALAITAAVVALVTL
jgi:hypothetical protein